MIDISRAIQHPFQDQNWLSKLAIGALINAVPILNFAGTGYLIEHLNNTKNGHDVPLPTWDNLGDKFVEGLKLIVVLFIYSLPIILLSCILGIVGGGIAAITSGSDGTRASEAAGAGFGIVSLALGCLALLYAILLVYLYPAIAIQYARTKDIAACLRLGDVLAIARKNTGDYLMIFLVLIGVSVVLSIVGSILAITIIGLCLLIPLTILFTPYFNIVAANLCGQYERV